jgi:hypothetical protein
LCAATDCHKCSLCCVNEHRPPNWVGPKCLASPPWPLSASPQRCVSAFARKAELLLFLGSMLSWARSCDEGPPGHQARVADFFEHGQAVEHLSQRPSILLWPMAANDAILFGHRVVPQLAAPLFPWYLSSIGSGLGRHGYDP